MKRDLGLEWNGGREDPDLARQIARLLGRDATTDTERFNRRAYVRKCRAEGINPFSLVDPAFHFYRARDEML